MSFATRFNSIKDKALKLWNYCYSGVWSDPRRKWWVTVTKTLNLSVRSFMSGDVQTQACAMTYRTILAVIPALALILAIARGFGFQNYVEKELYLLFPAQKTAITYAWNFVDSYLNQASEGIFVGVGIVFLLYTLISLVGNAEDTFNLIWGVRQGRSLWRKITDYTALLLICPILMICAGGVNIMLSSTLNALFSWSFMTPVVSLLLELASMVLTWLFFAAVYMLFPNTRVKFLNALVAGIFAGTGFMILQWLFVTGQMYVARYNAIYGSFSFLPLLMIWMQLTWVVTLSGAVVCYSSQNIFSFSFDEEIKNMAPLYRRKAILATAAIITQRFIKGERPATRLEITEKFDIPARLTGEITSLLCQCGLVNQVVLDAKKSIYGYQLAVPPEQMTIQNVCHKIDTLGTHDFIPLFSKHFPGIDEAFVKLDQAMAQESGKLQLSNLQINPSKQ